MARSGKMKKLFERIWEFVHLWGTYHYENRIDASLAWELAGIFVDNPIGWDGMIVFKPEGEAE